MKVNKMMKQINAKNKMNQRRKSKNKTEKNGKME